MTSALLRRREARERLIDAHLARRDLVLFEDARPVLEMVPAICRDGRIVQAAETRVAARRIADGKLRLIALTGYGQPEDVERSYAAGFNDHLVKPVSAQALEAILASGPVDIRPV